MIRFFRPMRGGQICLFKRAHGAFYELPAVYCHLCSPPINLLKGKRASGPGNRIIGCPARPIMLLYVARPGPVWGTKFSSWNGSRLKTNERCKFFSPDRPVFYILVFSRRSAAFPVTWKRASAYEVDPCQ